MVAALPSFNEADHSLRAPQSMERGRDCKDAFYTPGSLTRLIKGTPDAADFEKCTAWKRSTGIFGGSKECHICVGFEHKSKIVKNFRCSHKCGSGSAKKMVLLRLAA